MDRWVKVIAQGGHLRASAVSAVALVNEAARRHKLKGPAIVALGEGLLAGLLLASRSKVGERLSLSVRSSGRVRQLHVDADPGGAARGLVMDADREPAEAPLGPWGVGQLTVVRLKEHQKEPYVGTCELLTGHLAKDLTFYLTQSEQIPSAVGIAVTLNASGTAAEHAGAFLVEVMPDATERELRMIEENLHKMHGLAEQLRQSESPLHLLGGIFTDVAFTLLEEKELIFRCNCSRERLARALLILGVEELGDMLQRDEGADARCDFCNETYHFTQPELAALIRSLRKK